MRTTTNKDITTGIQPHTSEERIQIPKTDNFIMENSTFGFLFFFFLEIRGVKIIELLDSPLRGLQRGFPEQQGKEKH